MTDTFPYRLTQTPETVTIWEDRYGVWWFEMSGHLFHRSGLAGPWERTTSGWEDVDQACGPLWRVPSETRGTITE